MGVQDAGEFVLTSVCLSGARSLGAADFEKRTSEIYLAIERELRARPASNPVRLWNYLPDIHAPASNGTDRYMSFNAGRYHAYSQWLGGAGAFDRTVPTASAVGHDGTDLFVHALASHSPGIAVANPRQIAPYRYSRRFGPHPPFLARATVIAPVNGHGRQILVGGTASIRGEESIHVGHLPAQLTETFSNLAYLIKSANGHAVDPAIDLNAAEMLHWLRQFRDLRVYYVRESDRTFLSQRVAETFTPDCRVEYVRANLCRAELLVEIEGFAHG